MNSAFVGEWTLHILECMEQRKKIKNSIIIIIIIITVSPTLYYM